MAETFAQRLERECRELLAALRPLLAAPPRDDAAFRDALELLARRPRFAHFTWLWGPVVAERDRVLFRPFVLSHFSDWALDDKGRAFEAWNESPKASLDRWLKECDERNDVELTRRLLAWRYRERPAKTREVEWRQDVTRRLRAASSPGRRFEALAKLDVPWLTLDPATAVELVRLDPVASRAFVLGHLPYFGWLGAKSKEWIPLLEATVAHEDLHFEVYRRVVDLERFQADAVRLAAEPSPPEALDRELERRHPRAVHEGLGTVYLSLLRARGRDVVPYVLRHIDRVFPRLGREAKGVPEMVALADERGWHDLWGAVLRGAASQALFDREVARLVADTRMPALASELRLRQLAGRGAEWNGAGVSWAVVHPLNEATALALYRRWPELVRGPFRAHVSPGWQAAYAKLLGQVVEARDDELFDHLASRLAMATRRQRDWESASALAMRHLEGLSDEAFVERAASILGRIPAFAIWSYEALLRDDPLTRLLFERSTPLYLQSSAAVRDLLEAPQIHVQALALRVLGQPDPRAVAMAASHADLLQATLFRPLHRRTRLLAFAALENATRHDLDTARWLLGRLREALVLPDRRYPKDELVGLLGRVLHRWPELRRRSEVPSVFGPGRGGTSASGSSEEASP